MTDDVVLGLATFHALVKTFEPCRDWLENETDLDERILYRARLNFIDSARVTKWKAYVPVPNPRDCAILAEDLRGWAEPPGLIAEFETTGPNTQIRLAFINMAVRFETRAAEGGWE